MSAMFPFGLETPLLAYLGLYLLTLVVHAFFAAYVLAGSLWLLWATSFPGAASTARADQPLAGILRDWMPFVLSAAVTAAVAPLLFVQIVYRQQFYTANLLLGWRWMMVVPVLIAAFYLLYLLKSRTLSSLHRVWSIGISLSAAVCFVFVAFCWTTNHLLSIDGDQWGTAWQTGTVVRSVPTLVIRLMLWIAGAFAVMPVLAAWQLAFRQADASGFGASSVSVEVVRLGRVTLTACGTAIVLGFGYGTLLSAEEQTDLTGAAGWPWLVITAAAIVAQVFGWSLMWRARQLSIRSLLIVSSGCGVMLLGTAVLRELIRFGQIRQEAVIANAEAAAEVGGLLVFLLFALINTALIVLCVRIVRRSGDHSDASGR